MSLSLTSVWSSETHLLVDVVNDHCSVFFKHQTGRDNCSNNIIRAGPSGKLELRKSGFPVGVHLTHPEEMDTNYSLQWTQRADLGLLCCRTVEDGRGTTTFCHFITLSWQEGKTQVMAEAVPGVPQEDFWGGIIPSLLPLSSFLGVNHSKKKHLF